jgi:DNA-binding MarR family transcriptional regulator
VKSAPLTSRLACAAYSLRTVLEGELLETRDGFELTLALADTLWELDPARGPISRRELAERLHCHPSNVTFLADRLESRALVARGRAGEDGRVSTLALSRPALRPACPDRHTRRSKLFSRLTSTQQRDLCGLLARCVDSRPAVRARRPAARAAGRGLPRNLTPGRFSRR